MTPVIDKEQSEILFFNSFKELEKSNYFLTVYDGQFDWGGRLLKCNDGVQR